MVIHELYPRCLPTADLRSRGDSKTVAGIGQAYTRGGAAASGCQEESGVPAPDPDLYPGSMAVFPAFIAVTPPDTMNAMNSAPSASSGYTLSFGTTIRFPAKLYDSGR